MGKYSLGGLITDSLVSELSLRIYCVGWINVLFEIGYDKAAQPLQVLPRKVTKITLPVMDISITDTAMACLLGTQDVICIWNDRHFKIKYVK